MRILPGTILFLALACSFAASASEPQSLSARIGDTIFVSDDDGITLVPVGNASGSFSLSATTQGASAYPPPKTPVDRLSIICSGMAAGKPMKLDSKWFSRAECDVRFVKGVKMMGGDPDAEYTLDKDHAGNVFEVESAAGKRYTGRFNFRLVDATGTAHLVTDGKFVVEDRQL
ncbi:hypothetical protein [Tahibacter sp.]|uniref:hypothetical protein n=1 Tax=Tahibacter sp. TaxID=2056211 RepID=UPI0028C46024|nr:hypothetical protein [Tahibacter sp.]